MLNCVLKALRCKKRKEIVMKPIKMQVRELRRLFYDFEHLYAVLFDEEMSNSEVRRALYEMDDQDQLLAVVQEEDCVMISSPKKPRVERVTTPALKLENGDTIVAIDDTGFYGTQYYVRIGNEIFIYKEEEMMEIYGVAPKGMYY